MSRSSAGTDGPAPGWLAAGYAGLAGFLVLEGLARERGGASSLDSADDRGTTRLILGAYGLAAGLPPLLRTLRGGRLPRLAGPLGLATEAAGLGLRLWSMRTLRSSYSRTLRTSAGQQVTERGPYRRIRHPGYLGSLLTWIGCSVTSGSAPAAAAVTGLLAAAYVRRITAEEALLRRELPGYGDYAGRTKRLIPLVW
jgi:protein-S-isoprenylcysteine O-methyltransferase Ste14